MPPKAGTSCGAGRSPRREAARREHRRRSGRGWRRSRRRARRRRRCWPATRPATCSRVAFTKDWYEAVFGVAPQQSSSRTTSVRRRAHRCRAGCRRTGTVARPTPSRCRVGTLRRVSCRHPNGARPAAASRSCRAGRRPAPAGNAMRRSRTSATICSVAVVVVHAVGRDDHELSESLGCLLASSLGGGEVAFAPRA